MLDFLAINGSQWTYVKSDSAKADGLKEAQVFSSLSDTRHQELPNEASFGSRLVSNIEIEHKIKSSSDST